MGLVSYICGRLKCLSCGIEVEECIQTKLIATTVATSSSNYSAGDIVSLDGICDFIEIRSWNSPGELRVVIGDWQCSSCRLTYQWAVVSLTVIGGDIDKLTSVDARINSVQEFVPSIAAFGTIHYAEEELVGFAFFPSDWGVEEVASCRLPDASVISAVVTGYRQWVREEAGAELPE